MALGFAHKDSTDEKVINDKIEAIKVIGDFLMHYDSDRQIDIYGFNGILPGTCHSSRFFALNGQFFSPDVNGIDECVELYQKATEVVKYGPPAYLSEVVRHVNEKEKYIKEHPEA